MHLPTSLCLPEAVSWDRTLIHYQLHSALPGALRRTRGEGQGMGSVHVSSSDINTAVTWWHLFGLHGEEGAALGLEGPVGVVHREATWETFKYVGVESLRAPPPHPHTQAVPQVGVQLPPQRHP